MRSATRVIGRAVLALAVVGGTGLGMLGRSEGCFAVDPSSLDEILLRLGPGRLIYADRA